MIRNEIPSIDYTTKKNSKPHLLFIGNGYKRKGLKPLLLACKNLRFDFHLDIIGKEKKIQKYQKLVVNTSLEKKVQFHGMQKDLFSFYKKSDLLILPTLYDPSSNVVLEALGHHLQVITSQKDGSKEILDPQNILQTLSAKEIQNKIEFLVKNPRKKAYFNELEFTKQFDKMADIICQ